MRKIHQLSFVLVGALLLLSFVSIAQNSRIDSLKAIVETGKKDSVMVSTLNQLYQEFLNEGNLEDAYVYAEQAFVLSTQIKYIDGEAMSLKNMGVVEFIKGNYMEALPYWTRALENFEASGNKLGQIQTMNNLGVYYYQSGLHDRALEYYLRSLDAAEDLNDKVNTAKAMLNIGGVYNEMLDYDKAMKFFNSAKPLLEQVEDSSLYSKYLMGIGEVYLEKGQYEEAKETYKEAIEIASLLDRADLLKNLGRAEMFLGNHQRAIEYLTEAFETADANSQQLVKVQVLISLANLYSSYNYQEGINTFKEAEAIAKEMEINDELRDIYEGMSKTYASMGDYDKAFEYQELYIAQKDLVFNLETDNEIRNLQFDFDLQKKQDEIDLLEKEAEIQVLQEKRQKTVTWAVSILLFFIGLLALSQYRRYRFTKATNKVIQKEKERSDKLLLNILPEETAFELKENGRVGAQRFDKVTVLFTDFVGFTKSSEDLEPEELVSSVDHYFSHFDSIVDKYGLEKIKTIGDSYMCAGGLPHPDAQHVVKIIMAAMEMREFVEESQKKADKISLPFEVRIGLNTGAVVAGVVGTKKFAYDIWGDTVNTASRMESGSEPGQINVSESTYQEVKDYFEFEYRGEKKVKGKEKVKMYFVTGIKDQHLIDNFLAQGSNVSKKIAV